MPMPKILLVVIDGTVTDVLADQPVSFAIANHDGKHIQAVEHALGVLDIFEEAQVVDLPISIERQRLAMRGRIQLMEQAVDQQLISDLWSFIEDVTDNDPERQDKFFALRARVRERNAP